MPDSKVVDWLLNGEGWVEYQTRLELLGESPNNPTALAAKKHMLENPLVQGLLAALANWPGSVIASHKSAGQPFHKLTFLADIGLNKTDPGMQMIIDQILSHQSAEGPFQLPNNIGESYGGTGQQTWGWALCDAPLLLYSLVKFGLGDDPRVQKGIQHLVNLARENGWPCAVSKELGTWRGPGKKDDPCPYATMVMLKLLSVVKELQDSSAAHQGVESLLGLWQDSQTRHPYIFYMGDDFRKLKVPLVWYDLVHLLDVLSRFEWARTDARYLEILSVLTNKMDAEGCFTLESVWTVWKDWEFGQKKIPSRWLTLSARSIMHRSQS